MIANWFLATTFTDLKSVMQRGNMRSLISKREYFDPAIGCESGAYAAFFTIKIYLHLAKYETTLQEETDEPI